MAKPSLYYDVMPHFHTSTGDLANGYKVFFYVPGTTTKKDTYTDSTKSTPNSNPMTLNSRGEFTTDVWLDGSYKVVFTSSTDSDPPVAPIKTVDNVTSMQQLITTVSKTSNYTVVESDNFKQILVDASGGAVTITLLAAATAGDGFTIGIKKIDSSANVVTIDGNSSETIDTLTTYPLNQQNDGVILIGNASNWFTKEGHNQTIIDKNGNEGLIISSTASAVNEVTIGNAATGTNPTISGTGGDTNIGVNIINKGTGQSSVRTEDSRTNTTVFPLNIRATTSGTPAAAIGTGINFQAESADESPSDFGAVSFAANDVTAGSEDTAFGVWTRTAGAALAIAYSFNVTGAGAYNITGAPTATRTITLPNTDISNAVVQRVSTQTGAAATTTASIPVDDTIPQISEGTEFMTLAITPKSTANILVIDIVFCAAHSIAATSAVALFQDATANALAGCIQTYSINNAALVTTFRHTMSAGTVSSTTFRVRSGATGGTLTFNGQSAARVLGGVSASSITITEYAS